MSERTINLHLGIGAIVAAAILVLYAIPTWVSSPTNVRNVILSPLFWPYVLAGITALTGLGLIAASLWRKTEGEAASDVESRRAAFVRLGILGAVMVATMFAMPRLGMVLTTMAVFAAVAFLVRTRHPFVALICAVVLPLMLYAFFMHVAGVAIPQGEFVRLP